MKKFFAKLLANTRDNKKHGFTLIELLIVIGILGILVVAVLLTLNPAEAQRKTRDSKRMKDLGAVQSAVQQYLDNGGTIPTGAGVVTVLSSSGTTNPSTGWLGINVSAYMSTLPLDPTNNAVRIVSNGCGATVSSSAANMAYRMSMNGITNANPGLFEVNARQESDSNCKNVANDGGNSTQWAEVGTDLTLITD